MSKYVNRLLKYDRQIYMLNSVTETCTDII